MKFSNALEIGAGDFRSCFLLQNRDKFENITLYEPNRLLFNDLGQNIKDFTNVTVYNYAVSDYFATNGVFYNVGRSSFLKGAQSFLNLAHEEKPEEYLIKLTTLVTVKNIQDIDNGDIDFLSINCNGSEVSILNKLKSRPKVIRSCYYIHNSRQNLFYNQITEWAGANAYKIKDYSKNKLGTFFELFFVKT